MKTLLVENLSVILVCALISSGIISILVVARKEQKRRGGKLFDPIKEDIEMNPVPAITGYTLLFFFGWFRVLYPAFLFCLVSPFGLLIKITNRTKK